MTTAADPALGGRLREARRAAGLSLRALAAAVGVSPATWSAVENGRAAPGASRLGAAASVLGVSLDALTAPGTAPAGPTPAPDWRRFGPLDLPPALRGALAAFVELGYHGASIRDVAARAGLSVPGVYHHHPSKQHLLVALVDLTLDELTDRVGRARAEGDGPVERVSNLVECLALFHTHRRDLGFLGATEMRSLAEPDRTRIVVLRRSVQRTVDEEVVEGCRRGLFATPTPAEAARAVVTLCTALPQWWSPAGPDGPEVIARTYVDLALDLLRAGR